MNRLITLALCLAMALSLSACAEAPVPTEPAAPLATLAPQIPTEAPTEAVVETPDAPELTFDPAWAGSRHEMPIPPFPVEDYTLSYSNYGPDFHYEILSDGDQIKKLTLDTVTTYWESVKACGFDRNVSETTKEGKGGAITYLYEAETQSGATIYLAYPGYMLYLILDIPTDVNVEIPEETEPQVPVNAYDTNWATNCYELLIPQPPFAWEVWESACNDSTHVLRSIENPDWDTIAGYCAALKGVGFTSVLEEESSENKSGYSFYATNDSGNAVSLEYDGTVATIFLTGPIASAAFRICWEPAGIPAPPKWENAFWNASMEANQLYHLSSQALTLQEVWDYASALQDMGFTSPPAESAPAGENCRYFFSASNEETTHISICMDTDGRTTITLKAPH
jgi:hypothetical protein